VPHLTIRRLGKSISRRRQYLKYREEHHERLAAGLEDFRENVTLANPSTVATALPLPEERQSSHQTDRSDSESILTDLSYTSTQSGAHDLKPPPRPSAAAHDEPFECSICFHIIIANDERQWRRHVYEDLLPYLCVCEVRITRTPILAMFTDRCRDLPGLCDRYATIRLRKGVEKSHGRTQQALAVSIRMCRTLQVSRRI
jgi:hypothetical protein